MPFKFKLSKRLALLKASLAASAALALACDRNDLTSPQPSPRPLAAAVTSLSVLSVTASGNDGNVPQNTLDNNLTTRWSAYGDGQWIRYDLGAPTAVSRVDIAWHNGTAWASAFEIQVSSDTITWIKVFAGWSSGQTLQFERYDFPTVTGRYVRIVGHGQWSGTTLLSLWNSITEVAIYDAPVTVNPVPVTSVTVNPASASVSVGSTQQLSAAVKDTTGSALTGRTVTWTTSDRAVATVTPSGLGRGLAVGRGALTAPNE